MLQSDIHTTMKDNVLRSDAGQCIDPIFLRMYTKMLSVMPSCQTISTDIVQEVVRESFLYSKHLKQTLPDFFGHRSKGTSQTFSKDYFDLVVVMVVAADTVADVRLCSEAILNMLGCTLINWELDDYIEKSVDCESEQSFNAMKRAIDGIFEDHSSTQDGQEESILPSPAKRRRGSISLRHTMTPVSKVNDITIRLKAYVTWQLSQLDIISPSLKPQLSHDLHTWFISEIQQILDSKAHYSPHSTSPTKSQSLNSYLHGNGHIHAGFYPLYTLLIAFTSSQYAPHPSPSPYTSFIMSEHLRQTAIKERMVNDLVSLKRDRAEQNLSCFDFPEFGLRKGLEGDEEKAQKAMKLLEEMINGQEEVCDGLRERLDWLGAGMWCAERVAVRCLDAMVYIHKDVYRMVK